MYRVFLLALCALPLGLSPSAEQVNAAGIVVTTTGDEFNSDGDCSLREAITSANTDTAVDACQAGSGTDTINVPAGSYTLSIPGAGEDANATGDLDITSDLIINGESQTTTIVDAAYLDSVVHIVDDVSLTMSAVTIRRGSRAGIGVQQGRLTLTDSTVSDNMGPGITSWSGTDISLLNVTISNNTTGGYGGGFENGSGAATIINTTITENSASIGAGISNSGTVQLIDSTVSDNFATQAGGGIFNTGTLTLTNSTVSSNVGGAIGNFHTVNLTNSTLSGNIGTGIATYIGPVTINNSTITNNLAYGAGVPGGIYNDLSAPSTVTVRDTIIAHNADINCRGAIVSVGHNLSSDGSCRFLAAGDVQNVDPMLGPLDNNGGPTKTHALLSLTSPAADTGSENCPPPATDQRGVARPQGKRCDIGAFEAIDSDGDVLADEAETSVHFTDPFDPDTDKDGCADGEEIGPGQGLGGQRNPTNFWDFFDTDTESGTAAGTHLEGAVTVNDILRVVLHFGQMGDPSIDPLSDASAVGSYHTRYDRTVIGPNAWNLGPPDGAIAVNDIVLVVLQFGHNCLSPP